MTTRPRLVSARLGLTPERLEAEFPRLISAEITAWGTVFDEHLRMSPAIRFSRSATQAKGGVMAGKHTDAILTELGYASERIAGLREHDVIAG